MNNFIGNPDLEVCGVAKDTFMLAVRTAFSLCDCMAAHAFGGAVLDARSVTQGEETGTLILYSDRTGVDKKPKPFLTPLSPEDAAIEAWKWLKTVDRDKYPNAINLDGPFVQGWRVFLMPRQHAFGGEIVCIQPRFGWAGK